MLFDHYPIDFFEKIRAENAKSAVEDLRDRGFIKLQSGTTVIRIRDKKVIDIATADA